MKRLGLFCVFCGLLTGPMGGAVLLSSLRFSALGWLILPISLAYFIGGIRLVRRPMAKQ